MRQTKMSGTTMGVCTALGHQSSSASSGHLLQGSDTRRAQEAECLNDRTQLICEELAGVRQQPSLWHSLAALHTADAGYGDPALIEPIEIP